MSVPDRPGLGVELRQVLDELDVTPEEVATANGMSASTIKAIRNAKPTTGYTVRSIADGIAVLTGGDGFEVFARLVAAAKSDEDWVTDERYQPRPGVNRRRWAAKADPGGAQAMRQARRGVVMVEVVPQPAIEHPLRGVL